MNFSYLEFLMFFTVPYVEYQAFFVLKMIEIVLIFSDFTEK